MTQQAWVQLQGVVVVVAWSVAVTYLIIKVAAFFMAVRAKPEAEIEGLDMHVHGERAWHGISG